MELRLPQHGMTMTEGTLVSWLVEDGAQVTIGQPIYCLEADKANVEITAPISGTISQSGQTGEIYAVGDIIGNIEP